MSSAEENIINTLVQSMQGENKPEAYDTGATITRIENGVAWVHIPGGVDETPVKLTIAAEVGDEVQVRVSGGSAFLVGNATAPPTDDKVANKAVAEASEAAEAAEVAVKTAEAAAKIAGDTNQYFWHTEEGTDTGAHITEMPREDFLADPDNGGGNLLARSNGIAVRDGLDELAVFSADGTDLYSTYGSTKFLVAHMGYGTCQDSGGNPVRGLFFSFGARASSSPAGAYSLAEGAATTASGSASHAEGTQTFAAGDSSHAEGGLCVASGDYSHAQNQSTQAGYTYQTAIGKWNDNQSTSAFEIGNGAVGARSNALTVDWDGNVKAAGDIEDGSGNVLSALATLLSEALLYRNKQVISSSTTIAARSATSNITVNADVIDGYTPVFVSPRNTGNQSTHFRYCYLNTVGQAKNGQIVVALGNPSASSVTVSSAYVNVLYAKNELVGG